MIHPTRNRTRKSKFTSK